VTVGVILLLVFHSKRVEGPAMEAAAGNPADGIDGLDAPDGESRREEADASGRPGI